MKRPGLCRLTVLSSVVLCDRIGRMRLSVYVPCRNNETTLAEVLWSLHNQTRPADQFLFIHDRCTDRSPAIAADSGFDVHEQVGKIGLAAGRNQALALADGDVLVGLDADVVAA